MKVVIFSDVHGNLPALEAMLKAEGDLCDYIFLGDAVGYGPYCDEVVRKIDSIATIKILGNHEQMYLDGSAHIDCSDLAKSFFDFTAPQFSEGDRINSWLDCSERYGYMFSHSVDCKRIYANNSVPNISVNMPTFIGHTHQQFIRFINGYPIYNVGSLGQNRADKRIAQYVVLHLDVASVEFKSILYDYNALFTKMIMLGYPQKLLSYYE